jgi:hypothetical protein
MNCTHHGAKFLKRQSDSNIGMDTRFGCHPLRNCVTNTGLPVFNIFKIDGIRGDRLLLFWPFFCFFFMFLLVF